MLAQCLLLQKASKFRCKSLSKSYGNQSENLAIFILCCKCLIWCWWVWRVYENVSRVLQTRKTTKNHMRFLIIHYNRDLYTNGHLLLSIILPPVWVALEERRKNDLPRKLLGPRSWALETVMTSVPRTFPVFFVAVAVREAAVASLRAGMKMIWFCHKSLDSVTCLPEPNHMPTL